MDRLFLKEIEAWTADDLRSLIASQIPEGMRLDYKRDLNLGRDKEKAEAAKDVSGLANAQGGLLLYGIGEDDSPEPRPEKIHPISQEGLQTRLENVLDSSLEPRAEFSVATIPVDDGAVIAVRVAPHRGAPIMVQGYGEYRYYRRNGTRTIRMSASEVSEAHAAATGRVEELDEVLASLPLKARVARKRSLDELNLSLAGREKPDPWPPLATVIVAAVDAPRPLFPPRVLSPDAFPENVDGRRRPNVAVRPIGRWVLDAFGLHEEPGAVNQMLTQRVAIFRQGVFEWAHRYRSGDPRLPGRTYADDVHDVLLYASGVFAEVGYFGRLATYVRIENAEHVVPDIPADWDLSVSPAAVEWVGHFKEVSVDELRLDPTSTVCEAMDVIWQAFGVPRCPYFSADGDWIDP